MNSHTNHNLLQIIQAEISQVEKQFIRWRLTLAQLSKSSNLKHLQLAETLTIKLDSIHFYVGQFCLKLQDQLKKINNKISQIQNTPSVAISTTQRASEGQQQYYSIINKKINSLEERLKETQNNQRKLISTINQLMSRYHIHEQPSFIKNDEYLMSKIQNTGASHPTAIFQPYDLSNNHISALPLSSTMSKLQLRSKQIQSQRSLIQNQRLEKRIHTDQPIKYSQQMRTISKHRSYKLNQNNALLQINFPSYDLTKINNGEDRLINVKNFSQVREKEHRLNFLMQNLTK